MSGHPNHGVRSRTKGFLGWLGIAGCLTSVILARMYPAKRAPSFDEIHYLNLLRLGWQSVLDGTTTAYRASKSLPFLLAHALFPLGQGTGWDYPALYRAMDLLNWSCLLFVAWALAKILKLQHAPHLVPLAWVLLLCNRAFLHFYPFYPILPDTFMLALGTAFWLGFFRKDWRWVWGSYLASTFTNPQLTLFMLVCMAFTLPTAASANQVPVPSRQSYWALAFGAPFIALGLVAIYVAPHSTVATAESWGNVVYFKHPLTVALSGIAGALAMWLVAAPLQYWSWRDLYKSCNWKVGLLGLLVAVGASAVVSHYAINRFQGLKDAVRGIVIGASIVLSKPAPGILSFVIFLGLGGAFALLNWKALGRWIGLQGPGVALAFSSVMIATGLGGEVRHVIFLFPLIIVGICHVAGNALAKLPLYVWIWSGLILSLNWLVFLTLDPSYRGERELSAFGMCWTVPHYWAALGIVLLSLWAIRRLVPKESPVSQTP